MFGIFGKKARRAAVEIKKFEKRDLAQAVINAAYLVAYADGECEASEKAKIEQILRNQPALSAFTSEINAISATIIGQLDTNFKIGRRAALREIEDVKHDTREAEDVLDVAVAIAEATPGAYQPQSLSGVSLRSGQCDFLCGQIAPGRWLTHPKERHDVWYFW
ncbi:tellurite resistance TerB family protein [Escherichia coli]